MNLVDLDEVQYDLEQDGEQVRKQLARKIWEDRGWATVAVAFQERDAAGEWKPTKVALLRFRRIHEVWKKQAAITLSLDDARALADTIASWQL
ncbi:MAG TPA: hypothetical protein VIV40_33340 [Kofleriaceae bacterium]